MLDNNHNRVSVAETLSPSEENFTNLTPSSRDTRETASGFFPKNKVRGMHIQRILTNFFPNKNITYKKKVVVKKVHYYTYFVLVADK